MTTQLTNHETALKALDQTMSKLGAESVNVARPKLGIALVEAAFNGIIDEDDVEARYDAYLRGRENKQSRNLLAVGMEEGNGKKANVSKCRQLVRMAMLPGIDGPALIDRAVTMRGNMVGGDDKVEAPFDVMVKVARAQIAQPQEDLSDDQIADCIRKGEPAQKSELDKLIAAYKTTVKLADAMPMNVPLGQAVEDLRGAIVEAGGEVPAMTKEEKEREAFVKKAAAMGFRVAAE